MIGVLGGTSWPSTMLPYRMLNEGIQDRFKGHQSARIVLYSIDYHAIKSRYHEGWSDIPELLRQEVETLLSFRPDCWMLANNTLHKAYDLIAPQLASEIPFFHAVRLTRDHLVERRFERVLLLGTQFTMEDGFYAAPMTATGIRVDVPKLSDRQAIQVIQAQLSRGEVRKGFADFFAELLGTHEAAGCQAVVTACTELPLVIDQALTGMTVVDPLVLQCGACVQFAIAGRSDRAIE
ncbi:aspartate/glutamate racemase family protein [uncultured Enterovirga sp.]|uniref:aspartate/glutamate racemase family protein n=1 Tax=uncultured Enterovirga sp. TaxID=2026352 RepID=UPI0035CA8C2E